MTCGCRRRGSRCAPTTPSRGPGSTNSDDNARHLSVVPRMRTQSRRLRGRCGDLRGPEHGSEAHRPGPGASRPPPGGAAAPGAARRLVGGGRRAGDADRAGGPVCSTSGRTRTDERTADVRGSPAGRDRRGRAARRPQPGSGSTPDPEATSCPTSSWSPIRASPSWSSSRSTWSTCGRRARSIAGSGTGHPTGGTGERPRGDLQRSHDQPVRRRPSGATVKVLCWELHLGGLPSGSRWS